MSLFFVVNQTYTAWSVNTDAWMDDYKSIIFSESKNTNFELQFPSESLYEWFFLLHQTYTAWSVNSDSQTNDYMSQIFLVNQRYKAQLVNSDSQSID